MLSRQMRRLLVVLLINYFSRIKDTILVSRSIRMNKKLGIYEGQWISCLTKEDIITIVKYLIELINSKAEIDDIDHLSNRRVRTVGEQLSSQFGVGLARMARTIRERMNVRDNEVFTPIDLINAKTLILCYKFFLWNQPTFSVYGSNQSAC